MTKELPQDYLYSKQQKLRTTFASIPPGEIDVARALAGKPFFKQKKVSSTKQPKTIILNNSSIHHRIEIINKLTKNGFKILFFQDGELKLWNKELGFYSSEISDGQLENLAQVKGFAKDQYVIIDDIKASEILGQGIEFSPAELMQLTEGQSAKLEKLAKNYEILIKLQLKKEEFDEFLANSHLYKLGCINQFNFSYEITKENLDKFFQILPNLQRMDFGLNARGVDFGEIESSQLASHDFKELNLRFGRITSEKLNETLAKCPNLKKLDLTRADDIDFSEVKLPTLKDLKYLKVARVKGITSEILNEILTKCPNLEILDILGCEDIDFKKLELSKFQNLKGLNLFATKITNGSLVELLTKCPNLENLDLGKCSNIDFTKLELPQLPKLKELNLRSEKVGRELAKILTKCPNLEKLNLNTCENVAFADLELLRLPNLKALDLYSAKINNENLTKLLRKCPNLEKLDLHNCNNIDFAKLELPRLLGLKELILTSTGVRDDELAKLLTNYPNLEKLDLNDCKDINFAKLELPRLLGLKELILNSTGVSDDGLAKLLTKCPNLEMLNLRGCLGIKLMFYEDYYVFNKKYNLSELTYLRALDLWNTEWYESKNFPVFVEQRPYLKIERPQELMKREVATGGPTSSGHDSRGSVTSGTETGHGGDGVTWVKETVHGRGSVTLGKETVHGRGSVTLGKEIVHGRDGVTSGKETGHGRDEPPHKGLGDHGVGGEKRVGRYESKEGERRPVDDETGLGDYTFQPREIFKPKEIQNHNFPPSEYRIYIFDSLVGDKYFKLSNSQGSERTITKTDNLQYEYNLHYAKSPDLYLGNIEIGNGRHPIPSLTPEDEILKFEASNAKANFRIIWREDIKQHYVEVSGMEEGECCSFLYLLKKGELNKFQDIPTQEENIEQILFEGHAIKIVPDSITKPSLNQLVKYFDSFEPKELLEDAGKNILQRIIEQKAGVCRHKSEAFKKIYDHFYPNEKAILCSNEEHTFVEIHAQDGSVQTIDLGGAYRESEIEEWQDAKAEFPAQIPAQQEPHQTIDLGGTESEIEEWHDAQDEFPAQIPAQQEPQVLELGVSKLISDISRDSKKHNILLQLKPEQIENFLERTIKEERFFVISNLDDIALTKKVVNDKGEVVDEPTPLAIFLNSEMADKTLVLDWSNAQTRHVALNSLLDENRKINGSKVAPIKVVDIISKEQKIGPDFYSRHQVKLMNTNLFNDEERQDKAVQSEIANGVIEFYDDDWESIIYGKIAYDANGKFIYEKSKLQEILKAERNSQFKALTIELKNAPFEDREFRLALEKAAAKEAESGRKISFVKSEEIYHKPQILDYDSSLDLPYQILNSSTIDALLNPYSITPEGKVVKLPIKEIPFLLTDDLNNQQWGLINSLIGKGGAAFYKASKERPIADSKSRIITTNDLHLYRDLNCTNKQEVIHINETTSISDLITAISYKDGKFVCQESELLTRIKDGKNIVLVGNPSKKLSDYLQSLFIAKPYLMANGERIEVQGSLQLICEQKTAENFPNFTTVDVSFTKDAIWAQFKDIENAGLLKAYIEKLAELGIEVEINYIRLKTALERMDLKENKNPLKHLLRLRPDYLSLKPAIENAWDELNPRHKAQKPPKTTGIAGRMAKVIKGLANSPFLFLVGPSGSGKSSIVRDNLSAQYDVIEGMENLERLTIVGDKPSLLLLDEANLSIDPNELSIFEELLYQGKLLINGKIRDIPPQNKVILTGNYSHFSGREQIPFINNHGNIMSWKALSFQEIKEEVALPILTKIFETSKDLITAADGIARFYEKYLVSSENKLITPRDIEMICFKSKQLFDKVKNIELATALAIYDEVANTLAKENRKIFRKELEKDFLLPEGTIKNLKLHLKDGAVKGLPKTDDFQIVKSRQNLLRCLDDFLAVNQLKSQHPELARKGKGGFLVTGESGGGKSFMVSQYLLAQGYKNSDELKPEQYQKEEKIFCYIDVSNIDQAVEKLKLAFDNGWIAVVDEINALPLENYLNNYLSGFGMDGKPSEKPGFAVVATQNPPEAYANRIKFSPALQNRFEQFYLKDYKDEELEKLTREAFSKRQPNASPEINFGEMIKRYKKEREAGVPLTPRYLLRE